MPATTNNNAKVNPSTICFASPAPDAIFRTVENPTAIPGTVNTRPKRITQPLGLLREGLIVSDIRGCNLISRTGDLGGADYGSFRIRNSESRIEHRPDLTNAQFRIPNLSPNCGYFPNSLTGISKWAVFTTPLRWN